MYLNYLNILNKTHMYKVNQQEEGRGTVNVNEFSTLEEAKQYIKDRWQGPDYVDSKTMFHTDYSEYTLEGFTLNDIGKLTYNQQEQCREYDFN